MDPSIEKRASISNLIDGEKRSELLSRPLQRLWGRRFYIMFAKQVSVCHVILVKGRYDQKYPFSASIWVLRHLKDVYRIKRLDSLSCFVENISLDFLLNKSIIAKTECSGSNFEIYETLICFSIRSQKFPGLRQLNSTNKLFRPALNLCSIKVLMRSSEFIDLFKFAKIKKPFFFYVLFWKAHL